jgi:ubiquinone/menaquinone biosynthesis C-methylase UbiE
MDARHDERHSGWNRPVRTFRDMEQQGWSAKAADYHDAFGRITAQAIAPVLESFGDLGGKSLLDVACGTGELAAAAALKGAIVTAVDFAEPMVDQARRLHTSVDYLVGDAESLNFPDHSFDAVTCAFGLLHIEHPEKAVAEARRVLRRGGRYTFVVWRSPDQGCDFYRIILDAVKEFGSLEVAMPPSPPVFRFSDLHECERILAGKGFLQPRVEVINLSWQTRLAQDFLHLIYKSVVRMSAILEAQDEGVKERIHASILENTEALRRNGVITLQFPAVLATGIAA